jgi:hypothetical protein
MHDHYREHYEYISFAGANAEDLETGFSLK